MSAIVVVAAVAQNGVIGRDGAMPWRLATDLRRFKADTIGKPVVMGRKTFEAIGKPLAGRHNIVVTRDRTWKTAGVETAGSLEQGLVLAGIRARCSADRTICVIGGAQIYAQTLPRADRLHITHVLADLAGDARFPPIDPDIWRAVSHEDVPAGQDDTYATRFVVYERRR